MQKHKIKVIIVYANRACTAAGALVISVARATDLPLKVAHSHTDLQRHLRQVITDEAIIVFHAYDKNDLRFLRSIRSSVKDTKLVLFLPDDNSSTFSEGFLSYPRFITYSDDNFSDVSPVLEKLLENNGPR